MKTILMILPEFGYGGAEKSFCALSVELAKFYKIKVVVFNLKQEAVYPVGGEVKSLNVFSSKLWIGKLGNIYKRVVRLKKIKRHVKPDVCISFLEGADYINILSSLGGSTILSIRGSKMHDQNIKSLLGLVRKKLLIPLLYAKANHIVTLSKGLEDELLEKYSHLKESRVHTINNTIDRDKVTLMANEPLSDYWASFYHNHKVIILSARLAIEKGIHLFLPVFAELIKHSDDLRLVIIGDGEYQDSLQQKCHELNLPYKTLIDQNNSTSAKVLFLGYQSNPFKWMRQADIFVSPSIHEGFGNSILEAITCDVPVIASDCPYGPREIIANSTYKSKIQYPYFGHNSILLPIINSRTLDLWFKTILDQLSKNNEEESLEDRNSLDLGRFSKDEFRKKWIEVIEAKY